jgi:calcineurin-like phosphoesterase family protein
VGFASVKRLAVIMIEGLKIMLTHDPCLVQPIDTLAICGHIHTLFSENWQPSRNTLTINVCVEVRNYEPISETEVLDLARQSEYRS